MTWPSSTVNERREPSTEYGSGENAASHGSKEGTEQEWGPKGVAVRLWLCGVR
ncbi:hypothetical protein ACIOEZ_16760 [Streptomyces sp. NPDC087866]|uniref:hypothetical protein n=1 Tax=unclassified Streptomyces TaxID=2593676 RepID=UPI0033B793A2